jgi:ATP-dependent DNA helicase RecG
VPLRDRSHKGLSGAAGRPPLRPWDPVDAVVGIGPKTAAGLAAAGVRTVVDLLLHLPQRYEDRSEVMAVADAFDGCGPVLLRGRVSVTSARRVRRRLHIADGTVVDGSGSLPVRWFNQPWVVDRLSGDGVTAFVYGSPGRARDGRLQLVNPEVQVVDDNEARDEVVPVYSRLGPLGGRRLRTVIKRAAVALGGIEDPLPPEVRLKLGLPTLGAALAELHRPSLPRGRDRRCRHVAVLNDRTGLEHRRLAFDELLAVAVEAADFRLRRLRQTAAPIRVGAAFAKACSDLLPFELTRAQRRVVDEVIADLGGTRPMARLLQGDVGSGKTVVAALAILASLEAGRQAALMAPTEILAEQLSRTVGCLLDRSGHEVRLLTGSVPAAEAEAIRTGLADGKIGLVIGTHALFQDKVAYADLGLVVVDEQHRFGVAQRQRLLDKGDAPHLLVMTATPIPRSLALTVYGDLDLSVIDELPPGRSPIRTEVRDASARPKIWRFLRSEIDAGGQVFVVYPLIEISDTIQATALEAHLADLQEALGGIEIGVVHGRLDRDQRERVAERFRGGELKAIMATTVIEVGLDVPAASVMVIESADRFGLSQLHQLRGRVGRGTRPSWCILITGDQPSADAEARLRVLARTTDGFEIAEADLRHRGPGELTGHRQWGVVGFRFADFHRHRDLVARAREVAADAIRSGRLTSLREALQLIHPMGEEFSIG